MDTDSFIMNIKTEDFTKMLLIMLKKDLILQTKSVIDLYL